MRTIVWLFILFFKLPAVIAHSSIFGLIGEYKLDANVCFNTLIHSLYKCSDLANNVIKYSNLIYGREAPGLTLDLFLGLRGLQFENR